jgi:hypothetical protein
MTSKNLVPASQLALNFGVKAVVYGPPGSGKTPLVETLKALNPVICATEPGMLSMRKSNIPTFPAYTGAAIREFLAWCQTPESLQYGVKVVDSGSQLAEIFLAEALPKHKDPRKAYGEMELEAMKFFEMLYFAPQTHVVVICKEVPALDGEQLRAYFPGKAINIKVPHRYDLVMRLAYTQIAGQRQRALQCKESFSAFARDRSGILAEYEPPDLHQLFTKILNS